MWLFTYSSQYVFFLTGTTLQVHQLLGFAADACQIFDINIYIVQKDTHCGLNE